MKKLINILLATAIFSALGCLAIYAIFAYAAPVALGAAVFGKSLHTIAGTFNLPNWATVSLFLALGPAFLLWLLRWFFPQKRRRQVAVFVVIVASLFALAKIVEKHKGDFATAFSRVERICIPIKPAVPTAERWFYPSGQPLLFYTQPGTNTWRFYRAYSGARDPNTGAELQPVTPLVRQQWEAEQMREREAEKTNEQEAARAALQGRCQQLESVQESLQREKAALLQERQAVLNGLLQQLETKQHELTAAETNMLPNSPLQIISQADHNLADVKTALINIMTNNSSVDLAVVQVQTAASNVDLAVDKIQVATAAQEKAKLDTMAEQVAAEAKEQQAATELQKLEDQRKQSELAAQNSAKKMRQQAAAVQPRQPDPVFAPQAQPEPVKRQSLNNNWPSRPREDEVVDLLVRNGTRYVLFIKFISPPDYVWPRPGRAFRAMPGESIRIVLRGIAGQEIFLTATTPNNPFARWGAEDQPPVATCGESGQVSVLVQ
jgi:hypothetical protein